MTQYKRLDPKRGPIDHIYQLQKMIGSTDTAPTGDVGVRGQFETIDPATGVSTYFGQLPDGSYGIEQFVNDVTPPGRPSTPTGTGVLGGAIIYWDGLDDTGAEQPKDYSRTVIEYSVDLLSWTASTTVYDKSTTTIGGLEVGVEHTFRLVSYDTNNNKSGYSGTVTIIPVATVDNADVDQAIADLKAEDTRLATAVDAAQSDATAASTAAATANDKALEAAGLAASKGRVIYASVAPTSAEDKSANNLWIDTDDNKPYRWNGTAWVGVTDKTATDAATAAGTAQTRADQAFAAAESAADAAGQAQTAADGKAKVWYTAAAPAGTLHAVNDLWFDSDDGNKPYRWNGTAWVSAQDAAISTAQTQANKALTTADGKNTSYYQTAQPTGGTYKVGDIWFDTDDNYKMRTWSGSAWQLTQDSAGAQAAAIAAAATDATTKANAAQAAAITAAAADATEKAEAAEAAAAATAALDASAKADQAEADALAAAKTYAELQASGAGSDALEAAKLDATTKADAAEAAAIAAAALDATAKAEQAEADAAADASVKADAALAKALSSARTYVNPAMSIDKVQRINGVSPVLVDSPTAMGGKALSKTGAANGWWEDRAGLQAIDPTVLYRMTARVRVVTPSTVNGKGFYFGAVGFADEGTTYVNATGSNSHSSQQWAIQNAQTPETGEWVDYVVYYKGISATSPAGSGTLASPKSFHSATKWFCPGLILDYSSGNGTWEMSHWSLEVIDAVGQQALLDAAAAKARAEDIKFEAMEASIAAGGFQKNPSFDEWPSTSSLPTGFSGWSNAPIKDTKNNRRGSFANRFDVPTADAQYGLNFGSTLLHAPNMEYVTVEVEFTLISGVLSGAGVLVDWGGLLPATLRAMVTLSYEVPSPIIGRTYRVVKTLKRPASTGGTFTSMTGFLMGNWSGLGAGAKSISYDWLNVRPASNEEITAFNAPADATAKANAAQKAATDAAALDATAKAEQAEANAAATAAADATAKADQAEADALAAAKTYAEAQASGASQTALDAAKLDATTKADAAEAAAIAAAALDATAKAEQAEADAAATAALDATAKADAAQSAAISAAAADATAKADAAQAAVSDEIARLRASGANLVVDPSVESTNGGVWGGRRTTESFRTGAASLKITANGTGVQDIALTTNMALIPGRILYVEAWVRTPSTTWSGQVNIASTMQTATGPVYPGPTGGLSTLAPGTGQEWTKLWGYITVPAGVVSGAPRISVRNTVTADTVFYWDDFLVLDVTEAREAIAAADKARQDAIDAAALDATNKANKALADAKADTVVQLRTKTRTWIQAAQPSLTGNITGDTWIDTDAGNKIYGWNGSAWVSMQDTAIATAQTAANTAQTAANGKNKVTYSTSVAPTGTVTGAIAGDTWFRKDANNVIIGHWEYSGTAYVAKTVGDAVIANLNAGKLIAGFVSADRLEAETIRSKVISATNINAVDILATGSITAASGVIGQLAVGSANIADLAVTDAKIDALNASKINAGIISADRLAANDIRAKLIAADLISAVDILASGSITAASGVIGSIDAGKITVGTLDASVIASKSLSTDKLLITSSDNVIQGGDFDTAAASWSKPASVLFSATAGVGSTGALAIYGNTTEVVSENLGPKIPVDPDAAFRGTLRLKSNEALPIGAVKVIMRCYVGNSTTPTNVVLESNTAALVIDTWTTFDTSIAKVPAGTTHVSFAIAGTNVTAAGFTYIDYVSSTRAATGSLIVDGALTGKLITGALIQSRSEQYRGIKLNDGQLVAYDATNSAAGETFRIDGETGSVSMKGTLLGGSLITGALITGATITGGVFQTKETGKRIVIQDQSYGSDIRLYPPLSNEYASISLTTNEEDSGTTAATDLLSIDGPINPATGRSSSRIGLQSYGLGSIYAENGFSMTAVNTLDLTAQSTTGVITMRAPTIRDSTGYVYNKKHAVELATFVNGWVNFGGGYSLLTSTITRPGFAYLEGMVKPGTIVDGVVIGNVKFTTHLPRYITMVSAVARTSTGTHVAIMCQLHTTEGIKLFGLPSNTAYVLISFGYELK